MSSVKELDSSDKEKQKCVDSNDSGSAKIISNELLVGVYSGAGKVDELTSLEQEIAKMHHVAPSTEYLQGENFSNGNNAVQNPESSNSKMIQHQQINELEGLQETEADDYLKCNPNDESNEIKQESDSTGLEHEDLIAVLKGFDDHAMTHIKGEGPAEIDNEQQRAPSITESEIAVTIEGEGQFQIMDVVYDEIDENNEPELPKEEPEPRNQSPKAKPSTTTGSNSKSQLTNEEIRAMAMEQMAGLKAIGERSRKRKQDIKPLQVDESADLVTSLGAEWSEDDAELEVKSKPGTNSLKISNSSTEPKIKKLDVEADTSAQSSNEKYATDQAIDPMNAIKKAKVEEGRSDNKSGDIKVVADETVAKKDSNSKAEAQPVVGFKRTRIIKRKLIWDPDAPETQISFAQFARNTAKMKSEARSQSTKPTLPTKSSSLSVLKNARGGEASKANRGTESKMGSVSVVSKAKGNTTTPLSLNVQAKDTTESTSVKAHSPAKRRSQTPVTNGSNAGSKKKRVSEIDRLVSDEGAANMLNSLESERSKLIAEQGANDKPHKPLMRSRAATISERISKRETTPTAQSKVSTIASTSAGGGGGGGVKVKRNVKQKPSSTWDYVYKQKASEDAMIIRRRSNSSYSSNASVRRLSVDTPITKSSNSSTKTAFAKSVQSSTAPGTGVTSSAPKTTAAKTNTPRSLLKSSNASNNVGVKESSITPSSFEFIKPEMKSNQKGNRRVKGSLSLGDELNSASDIKKSTTTAPIARRGSRSPATLDEKEKSKSKMAPKQSKEESVLSLTSAPQTSGSGSANISDVVVKKVAKVGQIIFNTQKARINYTFTSQMLNKLVDILDKLGKDADCNAVLITTNAPNFCYGIDFTDLTVGTLEKRKLSATQLAASVKNYLKALATFPKPLIAGVNGSNIGLGVMQLPLYDIVIGSDKGSYEAPYVKVGQVPEGYCIWNNTTKIRENYKTKLLWLGEKMHSTESALSGLVHKLTASGKVNDDALQTAKKVAAMSTESYRFMKKIAINKNLEIIGNALDEEFDQIIEQWTSSECYDNFKKFLESGHF